MKYIALSLIVLFALIVLQAYQSDKRTKRYKEAACVLSTICQTALQKEHLDATSFEELYYDAVDNMDCHGLSIDRDFIEDLRWAY